MKKELEILIHHTEDFADIWTKSALNKKNIKMIHIPDEGHLVEDGSESATLILAPRNQFSSVKEAFVYMFKKYVYYHEEWKSNYGTQLSPADWEKLLKEIWIPVYLKVVNFQEVSGDLFLLRLFAELSHLKMDTEALFELKEKARGLEAIELRRGIVDYDVFAINEEICLIYSWGITHLLED